MADNLRMNKNTKYAINALLLAFVFGSLGYALLKGDEGAIEGSASGRPVGLTVPAVEGVEPDWAVYFFYNDVYCDTCERLEGFALEAVKTHYADELESGSIAWRSIDMTTSDNEHYAVDFNLYSKSIVLIELDNGEEVRWKNLEDIWDLVYDKPAYMDYIRDSMKDFMSETQ